MDLCVTPVGAVLPGGVSMAELAASPDPGPPSYAQAERALCLDEQRALGQASARRRREFALGRVCAHRALAQLGVASMVVRRGHDGEPVWPAGVVGSITHTEGYVAAAAARCHRFAALGIDAEVHRPLPSAMHRIVMTAGERSSVARFSGDGVCWDAVIFSAKESVYKAWFPLARRWLGFADVVVSLDRASGTFSAHLNVPGPTVAGRALDGFDGRFTFRGGRVMTATSVPAGEA